MREIKFRAWDKIENKLFKVESMNFVDDSIFVQDNELGLRKKHGKFELMQYTGLKDKNGKEIYEGDILCFKNVKMEVLWDDLRAKFCVRYHNVWKRIIHKPDLLYKSMEWAKEKSEIIGNIYEHPELLK